MPSWIGAIWAFRALSGLVDQKPFFSLVDAAQQALVFLPNGALDHRLQMYRGTCRFFVGTDKLRLGQVGEAHQFLLQAQEDTFPSGNRYLTTSLSSMLGKSSLLQGELKLARKYHCQVLADARELGDDEMAADALLELAWIAFEWNDLKGAEQHAREALALAHHVHLQRQELSDRATLQFALITYAQGETAAALEQLSALLGGSQRAWTPNSFWLLPRLREWQGRLRITQGFVQAVQDSLSVPPQSSESTSFTEYLGEQILQGRLLLAQGKAQAALQQFAHLLPIAQEHLHQYAALEITLLLALTHAACQQDQQAHYWLRQTLVQTAHEGYIRLFLNEGKPLARLLRSGQRHLQDAPALRSYAHLLLRAVSQPSGWSQASRFPSDDVLFEPLSAQEQRVLRLLATGRSNQEMARELIVSVNTIKYHVKHLYQKLGVSNRLQASEAARHLNLGDASQ